MNRGLVEIESSRRDETSIHIRVFKNGYIVDEDVFCSKDDTEEHQRFYESVVEGYVPRVLESAVRDQGKKVVVEDHRKEDYVAPPSRFSGKGNRIQDSMYVTLLLCYEVRYPSRLARSSPISACIIFNPNRKREFASS